LSGLNNDIRDIVKLQEYVEMEDLLYKATQVEQQIKRKSIVRRSSSKFNPSWKDKSGKRDPHPPNLPRWFHMKKLLRVPTRKPLKPRM